MSPADDKKDDEVETEVVDETTLEEVPVEPEADAEVEADEADAGETEAAEVDAAETEADEAEVVEEPVAEEKPKRSRSRAKKAEEPVAEAPAPKPAAKPSPNGRPVVKAHAKYVRTSARKARLVCDHIRGKDVAEARAILAFTPRDAAKAWSKLLESAVANAEHNHELVGEDLRILEVHADEGPTLKRFRPRAMGRATRIRKRTSHLTITLTPKES